MIATPIVADTACDKMKIWKNFESEDFLFRVIGFRFENHQVVLENNPERSDQSQVEILLKSYIIKLYKVKSGKAKRCSRGNSHHRLPDLQRTKGIGKIESA